MSDGGERQGIQSAEQGLGILAALARARGPMALRDLSAAVGMSPSKAHRYLVSLRRVGFVTQDGPTGLYDLGEMALTVGLAALSRLNVSRIATEAAIRLNQTSDLTVLVCVWGERGPTIVSWYDASEIVVCNLSVGSLLPLLRSAAGRVFLAYLPRATTQPFVEAELAGMVSRMPLSRFRTPADVEGLVGQVRRHRLGRTQDEFLAGLMALAAPVFDHQGRLVATIGVLGVTGTLDGADAAAPEARLRAAAAGISRQLGFDPDGAELPLVERLAADDPAA